MKEKELIYCACGCGRQLENRDSRGRLRAMNWGHQSSQQREASRKRNLGRVSKMKGKKFPLEVRERMRNAHLGKPIPSEQRLKMVTNLRMKLKGKVGHPVSEETKRVLREYRSKQTIPSEAYEKLSRKTKERWANPEYKTRLSLAFKRHWAIPAEREKHLVALRKGRDKIKGENSPHWLGGLSFLPYTKDFNKELKLQIRQRDSYQCQLCGMTEAENKKSLTIHHIDYDKSNSIVGNLIAVCVSCNTKVNINRDYWQGHFSQTIQAKGIILYG